MTITPDALDTELSLGSAAARLEFLARRDAAAPAEAPADEHSFFSGAEPVGSGLDRQESLELIALGEVIARKAAAGRHALVVAALRAGATWEEVASAQATSPQRAHDGHLAWLTGLDGATAAEGRRIAGPRPS